MKRRKSLKSLLALILVFTLCVGMSSMSVSAFELGQPLFTVTEGEDGEKTITPVVQDEDKGGSDASETEEQDGDDADTENDADTETGDDADTETGDDSENDADTKNDADTEDDTETGDDADTETNPGDETAPDGDPGIGDVIGDNMGVDDNGQRAPAESEPEAEPDADTEGENGPEIATIAAMPARIDSVQTLQEAISIALSTEGTEDDIIELGPQINIIGNTGDVVIDGQNKITLRQGTNTMFSVTGSTLTIRDITLQGTEGVNKRAIYVNGENASLIMDHVTVKDFTSDDYYGGALRIASAKSININGCSFEGNQNAPANESWCYGGGAICLYGTVPEVMISNSTFTDNKAMTNEELQLSGGAIAVVELDGKLTITDCKFTNNEATYAGGAFALTNWSKTVDLGINNCEFTGNKAVGNTVSKGTDRENGMGGAIRVQIYSNSENSSVSFDDNIVDSNKGYIAGGGYSFNLVEGLGTKLTFGSGRITNNTSGWGGGIDYSAKKQIPLQLENVLITDNTAAYQGGGVWACPTSMVQMASTLGGAIYGNRIDASIEAENNPIEREESNGIDIHYSGESEKYAAQGYVTSMTVSQRATGGGLMTWYNDSIGNRYVEGNEPADPTLYTNTKEEFGLYGGLTTEFQQMAEDAATLVITGNKSTSYGGGIATNSPVDIGVTGADKSLHVQKIWKDTDGNVTTENLPASIQVTLVRVQGDAQVDLETVTLNAANGWTHDFTDLPAYDNNGKFSYTVKEAAVSGWTGTVEGGPAGEGSKYNYEFTITNTQTPPPPSTDNGPAPDYTSLSVEKVWADAGHEDERPSSVQVQLYRDGEPYGGTVTLSEANGWSHEWTRLNDDYTWTIGEVNVPEGYTSSVSGSGTSYTITNTYDEPDQPDQPDNPPPEEDIPDNPPPLSDLPEDDTPLADIPEEKTPLEDLPDLPEEDVPLADVPETGDVSLVWMLGAAASAAGLIWLSISGKKKEDGAG